MYDEKLAIEEILKLPDNARLHLAHVIRNGLGAILIDIEENRISCAAGEVMRLSEECRGLGI